MSKRQLCTATSLLSVLHMSNSTVTQAGSLSAKCSTAQQHRLQGWWSTAGSVVIDTDWFVLCIGCSDSIPARYRQPNLPPSEAISQTPHISSESFIVHRTDRHVSLVKAPPHFVKIAAACLGVASNDTYRDQTGTERDTDK